MKVWVCPQCGGKYEELIPAKSISCTGNNTHKRCEMKVKTHEPG